MVKPCKKHLSTSIICYVYNYCHGRYIIDGLLSTCMSVLFTCTYMYTYIYIYVYALKFPTFLGMLWRRRAKRH